MSLEIAGTPTFIERHAPSESKVIDFLRAGPHTSATISKATGIRIGYVDLILRRLNARGVAEVAGRAERVKNHGRYPLLWRLA